ncbi:MAG: agmatine deiminase family protein, partial [Deltaproteobacteria bacterium]|nr:agmatine deiminase family protein [Deltaproteobacteria bacterium]
MATSRDATAADPQVRAPRPAALRLPAEWEPHAATWLCWPHNRENWPDDLAEAEAEFEALVAALASSEPVHVLANAPPASTALSRANVSLHIVASDDAWLRDTGPTFVWRGGDLVALDWTFNAWGGLYPPWDRDAEVAARVAALAGVPVERPDLVLEGGAFDGDGEGTLVCTQSVALDAARNPGRRLDEIEREFERWLGAERVLWVEGELAGDTTAGHVDNMVRFTSPGRVACGLPGVGEALRGAKDARGRALQVVDLPPPPRVERAGHPLPASYANFYVANDLVAVPRYGAPDDEAAIEV